MTKHPKRHAAEANGHEPSDSALDELTLSKAAIEAVGDAVIIMSPELDLPGPVIRYTNAAFTVMTG